MLCANPSGRTSTSFAVKSVSGADEAAQKSVVTGPTTVTVFSSFALV
jgi:hypothetical protein